MLFQQMALEVEMNRCSLLEQVVAPVADHRILLGRTCSWMRLRSSSVVSLAEAAVRM